MVAPYPAVFLDLSGVLYEGSRPLAGAAAAVRRLRDAGVMLRFVTNTATESSTALARRLAHMKMPVDQSELYTAPVAARHYLLAHGLRPYALVHPAIHDEFADLASAAPNCVVLGDAGNALNYPNLNRAFQLCQQGAPLVGIGMNRYFMGEQGLMLDAGPFIRALEWAAGCSATIMGKPSVDFFATVVASTPYPACHCLMVGDDVDSDVCGAHQAGLAAALVRSGKFQPGDEQRLPPGALLADSLAALVAHWKL